MIISIDPKSTHLFVFTGQDDTTYRDVRRYYVAKQVTGRRMIIVCLDDLELAGLAGERADVSLGWDDGTPGLVHEGNIGFSHTKLTIRRKSRKGTRATLARILDKAPRS